MGGGCFGGLFSSRTVFGQGCFRAGLLIPVGGDGCVEDGGEDAFQLFQGDAELGVHGFHADVQDGGDLFIGQFVFLDEFEHEAATGGKRVDGFADHLLQFGGDEDRGGVGVDVQVFDVYSVEGDVFFFRPAEEVECCILDGDI